MPRESIENFIQWLSPFNPTRSYLLDQFRLGRAIVRAEGHRLWDEDGREMLDFLSQYGAVSFGHNHPELVAALQQALAERLPALGQPMIPVAARELAVRLAEITSGDLRHTVFTNSGAEAAEAAIKLARARTGRRTILSTTGGFHGKTLGALSATGKRLYQKPFGAPFPGFEMVPFGDIDALEAKLRREGADIAAFFVEPIQGEGGVIPAPPGYLASAVSLCRQHGVLFVADEIQTGLGRTGELFAMTPEIGVPDILLLAKSLGGGLMPIGAMIATKKAWDHEFGYLHSSTFAGNNLACRVGLRVLDLLEADDRRIVREVAEKGKYLIGRLEELRRKHPSVVKDVRGRGLLAGIEFHPFRGDDSYTMSFFSRSDYLVAVFAGHLLNVHGVLTAPVFNDAHVLRLEPPFTVERPEIDRAVDAIGCLCDTLERKDYAEVVRFLLGARRRSESRPVFAAPNPPQDVHRADEKGAFAFVVHYTDEDDFVHTDPSFRGFDRGEFERWRDWVQDSEPGVVYHHPGIRSSCGAVAEGWLIAVGMLPDHMLRLGRRKLIPILKDAIDLAREKGARIVGLGGFTSIVSRGGESLVGHGIPITSGNSLTAVIAVRGIEEALRRLEQPLSELDVAVVGAAGAIGRLCALLLSDRVGRLTLAGNPTRHGGLDRCREVAVEIEALRPGAPIRYGTDLDALLPEADVILVATSASDAIIGPAHLKPGAVVCDISRPRNVSAPAAARDDVLVFEGGLIELPGPYHFGTNLQGFRPGINLACLGEALLLALERDYADRSIGQVLDLEEAIRLGDAAVRHGFRVAPLEWRGRVHDEARLDQVRRKQSTTRRRRRSALS